MLEVDQEKFKELEKSIRECISTAKDMDGLKVYYATKEYGHWDILNAGVVALMSLTGTFIRPSGVKFSKGEPPVQF